MTKRRIAKHHTPVDPYGMRCAGVIDLDTTDEQLRARGLTDEAIAEFRAFGEAIRRKVEELRASKEADRED